MKIVVTPEFINSLKKLNNHLRWHWRILDWFRYELPTGVKNIFKFWIPVWNHRNFDSAYSLRLFAKSLETLADTIERGNEIEISKSKKVARIRELIEIVNRISDDDYIELAEQTLNIEVDTQFTFSDDEPVEVTESNKKVFNKAKELAELDIIRFCEIIKGQDASAFKVDQDNLTYEEIEELYFEKFDGTGIKGWWN